MECMALEVKSKKGGPCTKQEQGKRRKKVYELHFEKGFSAVSIANELDVNRNTVNEDIKYWLIQIASQFEDLDLGGIVLKQVERLEIQRKRLLAQLEKVEFDEKLRIEKMIFEIDYRILSFVSKIAEQKIRIECKPKDKISQEQVSQILKDIVFSKNIIHPECITDDIILKEIVSSTKCDAKYATDVLSMFKDIGLGMFLNEEFGFDYDLVSFVIAKGLLTTQERDAFEQKIKENQEKEEQRISGIKEKYEKEFGSNPDDWSNVIRYQMEREIECF